MRDTPERLRALAKEFFVAVPIDEHAWLAYHRFLEAILYELNADALADIIVEEMDAAVLGSDRRQFLYQVGFSLSYQAEPPRGAAVFDDLYARADREAGLVGPRTAATVSNLPENYFAARRGRAVRAEDNREQQRQEFDRDVQQIRSGGRLAWLPHLARIYFAIYTDVDQSLSPRARIAARLGEQRTDAALEALVCALSRNDVPSFAAVLALTAHHQYHDWWHALVAGLNERYSLGHGFAGLSDDFLKGMLAFDITNPVRSHQDGERWLVHPWRTALTERRPELVRDAYLAVARLRLSRNEQFVDGLSELLTEPAFEPYRRDIALDLLQQFPNASPFRLAELFDTVAKLSAAHDAFLQLAGPVISGHTAVDEPQRDLWLVAAYFLAPTRFENDVRQRAIARRGLVFDLRDRGGFALRGRPGEGALPLPVIEFMAQLTGSLFPETPHPPDGWSGDTNAWDASEHFHTLTNMISTVPSEPATDALVRLEADPQLQSYKPHILYALANQRQRRRDAEYERPDWPKTVAALANGVPATVADLHALLVSQLRDLAHRIARENSDISKQFWNVDSYARPTQPRPEEACRDDVVTLLRPSLLHLGITVEPEAHMVADNRADISVAMPGRKILCELKRDYHDDVWTALIGQLERFYAHDPESKGFGVYCVFWFGDKRPRPIPAPPNALARPRSACEMAVMLKALMPENMRERLAVIVVDVSGAV
jgi:hypothetical protein